MSSNEHDLKHFVDRQLPSPTHMEFTATRDRVLDQLRATPAHLQAARIAESAPPASRWRTGVTLAAAAALIALVATVPFQQADWIATVEAADGSSYSLETNTVLSANDPRGLQLTLKDGSRIEMRSASELLLVGAADGIGIRLLAGDIIVSAAKQRNGHLYVHTTDMTISVVGTVFLVNAGRDGSRVAVIEGEVRVREKNVDTRLRPGEQLATSPTIAQTRVEEAITWSRHADVHLSQLESFRKGMAQTAGVLSPLTVPGQTPLASAQAEFEEASIRECDPDNVPEPPVGARGGGANSFQMTPGRTYALCLTMATLVRTAYGYGPAVINPGGRGRAMNVNVVYSLGVEDGRRVRGGPDWVRSQRYTIEAVAGGPVDAETMRGPMLRALLERRFGLKVHVETEHIPAFALVVAPGGLKMKEGTCTPPDASYVELNSTAEMVRKNLDAARRGETTVSPCGYYGAMNGPNMIFVGAGFGMPAVGQPGGPPILNRTGIPATTRFNYVLEYALDMPQGGLESRQSAQIASDPSAVPRAPDLATALEQQLGLRLEPAQAPREFIVIDSIERPGPN